MKITKGLRFISLVIALILALVYCSGCTSGAFGGSTSSMSDEERLKQAYQNDQSKFVRFYKSTGERERIVPVEEIENYNSRYTDCNGTWFKNSFSGEDLRIYNAYLYAMENTFIGFDIYVEDNTKNFHYIREALSIDSPFLEQNINSYGEYIYKNAYSRHGRSITVRVEQFTAERWEKKMAALQKCREIVAKIPDECITQLQKMEYLYRYVCNNVEYVEYENMADNDYLYDAVMKGKTICDGYSNMLNLLFNLAGIECCEAMGSNVKDYSTATEEERRNANGHTWVVAKIGDRFYNFDPTFEDSAFTNDPDRRLIYFGYSDKRASIKYFDCEETRPKCTNEDRDFSFADYVVNDISEASVTKIASYTMQQYAQDDMRYYFVVKKELSEQQVNTFLNSYINRVYGIKSAKAFWLDDDKGITIIQVTVT